MGMFSFIANRTLSSKAGKEGAGRLKAFVKAGSSTLEGEYTCPECGKGGKISQTFKRPLMIKCGSCGEALRLSRLKDEIKKEKKKGL